MTRLIFWDRMPKIILQAALLFCCSPLFSQYLLVEHQQDSSGYLLRKGILLAKINDSDTSTVMMLDTMVGFPKSISNFAVCGTRLFVASLSKKFEVPDRDQYILRFEMYAIQESGLSLRERWKSGFRNKKDLRGPYDLDLADCRLCFSISDNGFVEQSTSLGLYDYRVGDIKYFFDLCRSMLNAKVPKTLHNRLLRVDDL